MKNEVGRHALQHWLEIHARGAVFLAVRDAEWYERLAGVEELVCGTDSLGPDIQLEHLNLKICNALNDAATALTRAELLHRKLVRSGGTWRLPE